ncbi:MAG: hypothetical protein GF401_04060 [Chitinivibrionales bacterium]|nr:hypothetical protein [Chitinivibrionales bacterium]
MSRNNKKIFLLPLLAGIGILAGASGVGARKASLPQHPSKISYVPLDWDLPLGAPYRETLDNGLRLYIAEDPTVPMVQMTGFITCGSLDDPAGKEGMGDLAVRLLRTGGTGRFPADTLDQLIELYAIDINFSLHETQLEFKCSFLSEHTDTALTILEEILFNPAFEQEKVDKEKALFRQMIRHRFNNPEPVVAAAYDKLLYPGEENSRLATEESVVSVTRKDLVDFHKKYFRTQNFILATAGKFKKQQMKNRLNTLFPKAGESKPLSFEKDITPAPEQKTLIVNKKLNQSYVRIGIPLIKRPHPDYYPLSVLNLILGGGGFTSRLGKKIRSDEGLTYSIRSTVEANYAYPSTFYISFFTKTPSTARATALSLAEVEKIRKEGVTPEELENAKKVLIDGFPSMFRTPYDIVETYAWSEYYGREADHFKVYPDKIKSITLDDVTRVAQKYLDPAKFRYVFVADTADLFAVDTFKEFSTEELEPVKTTVPDSLPSLP